MSEGIDIGGIHIGGTLGLAPMAGFADMAFRSVCRDHGCTYTVTEMISAKALCFSDKKTREIACLAPGEHPCAVQIFGSEPEVMARGAEIALEISGADILDINMGCPAGKIVSSGEGSALMKKPELASEIISAVKKAVSCPVTVKFRSGWDSSHINAVEFAQMAYRSGADGLCIHGRTSRQLYTGSADPEIMGRVVASVPIPVIVNGDISDRADAERLLRLTGAKFALVGRGALGNPWIFESVPHSPTVSERVGEYLRQTELAVQQKGERRALTESRAHICRYLNGFRGASSYRALAVTVSTLDDARALAEKILSETSGL